MDGRDAHGDAPDCAEALRMLREQAAALTEESAQETLTAASASGSQPNFITVVWSGTSTTPCVSVATDPYMLHPGLTRAGPQQQPAPQNDSRMPRKPKQPQDPPPLWLLGSTWQREDAARGRR